MDSYLFKFHKWYAKNTNSVAVEHPQYKADLGIKSLNPAWQ